MLRPEHRMQAQLPLVTSLLALGNRDEARVHLAEMKRIAPEHKQVRELEDRANK
jgi:hypothetical protein